MHKNPQGSKSEPANYAEKVYAGVVGKIVGVFLGQPIEGWSNERIERELGEVGWYVSGKLGKPIVVSDDDIAGTLTFIRALADHPSAGRAITPAQIGDTWLNYLIEHENTLAWGGLGRFTEHTAFLRLKAGIPAPRSGSMELNGRWIAEQIGSQIFIDGWAMVAPGDPELAADLAGRAARVSHDGEAVIAAQAVAAMEALAFIEPSMNALFDCAARLIPHNSRTYALHQDVRGWAAKHGDDWRQTLRCIHAKYHTQGAYMPHILPDHALMVMAWAHAPNDFTRAMLIGATCGGDTDCNLGNIGCLLGIKHGTAAFTTADGRDWREPIADRLVLPAAWGATDALREADVITRLGRQVMGWPLPPPPKGGTRLHFSQPGALHGFLTEDADHARTAHVPATGGAMAVTLRDVEVGRPALITTPTWLTPERLPALRDCYGGVKYPTLFSGQTITARLCADSANRAPVRAAIIVRHYASMGTPATTQEAFGAWVELKPGKSGQASLTVPDTAGLPVCHLGLAFCGVRTGLVLVESVDWGGTPAITYPAALYKLAYGYPYGWTLSGKPAATMQPCDDATILTANGNDDVLLSTGLATPDWRDYRLSVRGKLFLAEATGILARYNGLRRYLALTWQRESNCVTLHQRHDAELRLLAAATCNWQLMDDFELVLEVSGQTACAFANGKRLFETTFDGLVTGGIGLTTRQGSAHFTRIAVTPVKG